MTHRMVSTAPQDMPAPQVHKLLLSCIVPRPIAWISTLAPDGTPNLAPYSFFNGVSGNPPIVMFSASNRSARMGGGPKDTLYNVQATGEFVINIVDEALAEAMNETSGEWPPDVDEFVKAGLVAASSIDVRPPRVAAARIALEARLHQIVQISDSTSTIVLGRVVRFHIREDLLSEDGLVDAKRLQPVARLGGSAYTTLGRVFTMKRPRVQLDE